MSDIGRFERRLIDDRRVARPADKIEIRGLRVHGHHGVYDDEKRDGQMFVVDVVLQVDSQIAARTDDLEDTVDYGEMTRRVAELVRTTRFNLLEALAGHIADDLITSADAPAVSVTVTKPEVDVGEHVDALAVTVHRVRPVHIK